MRPLKRKPVAEARIFIRESLAFVRCSGNHSVMPTFPFHIASDREDPFPPVAELATIEADDPRAALELLAKQRIVGELVQSSRGCES